MLTTEEERLVEKTVRDMLRGGLPRTAMLTTEEEMLVDRTAEIMGGVTRRELLVALCRDCMEQRRPFDRILENLPKDED